MAPEVFGRMKDPLKFYPAAPTDVWSAAIVMINVITCRSPWDEPRPLPRSPSHAFNQFIRNPMILPLFLPLPRDLALILIEALDLNPYRRISARILRKKLARCKTFLYSPEELYRQEIWISNQLPLPLAPDYISRRLVQRSQPTPLTGVCDWRSHRIRYPNMLRLGDPGSAAGRLPIRAASEDSEGPVTPEVVAAQDPAIVEVEEMNLGRRVVDVQIATDAEAGEFFPDWSRSTR
jgi:hypothetical protein